MFTKGRYFITRTFREISNIFNRITVMQAHFGHTIDIWFLNNRGVVGAYGAFSHFLKKILT